MSLPPSLKAVAPKALPNALFRTTGAALGAAASLLFFTGVAQAEPAMWVIKDADSTIYLFGTVHLLRPEAVWKTPKIQKAMDEAEDLTLEIADVDDAQAMAPLIRKYGLDAARPLSSRLSAEDNAKLETVYKTLGLPPKALDPFKPWMAALTLSVLPLQKAGYDANSGVERLLKASAAARKEPVAGFETAEQQIRYFDDMPEAMQLEFLRQTVDEAPETVARLDSIAKAWEAGDVDAIGREMNDEMKKEAPQVYEVLLTRRNEAFARQIKAKLAGKGVSFVAVGAGHLAGPDSVQVQLAKLGVKAERR
jgi:hypothetical protein